MSKKTPIKKTKRRLKRTVRRSIAALLMITSIGVAAIPVPENYAEDGSSQVGLLASASELPEKYVYNIEAGRNICPSDGKTKIEITDEYYLQNGEFKNLNDEKTAGISRANTISMLSDGTYQLDWQYKFFTTIVEGNARGIIWRYNSTYQQDTVVLNPNIIADYEIIEEEGDKSFKAYYDKCLSDGIKYVLNNKPNIDNIDDAFFDEYFKSAYENYIKEWDEYEQKLKKWKEDPYATEETKPSKPYLEKTPNDLTDDQKLKYYCDQNKGKNNESLKGCKLVRVIDSSRKKPDGSNYTIYIPQKIEGKEPVGVFDSQNFKVSASTSIIGIGDEAFKGTKNVSYLTIPQEIKYIGKSAFEDSFIKEISFTNVERISDYAFKNCSQLTKVIMGEATTEVGTEAFYGCGLTSVIFPQSIEEIGPGAFAYCESLQAVDFSNISTSKVKIDEYAFYNDVALNSVNMMKANSESVTVDIDAIGDGAFAVESGVIGSLNKFVFPSKISKNIDSNNTGLGDCVLAGRTNLQEVIMPADYGRSSEVKIPENTFFNCSNLACVEFPDDGGGSCGLANYMTNESLGISDKLFASVSNKDFYVKGPEFDRYKEIALPRKSTWGAKTAVSEYVPYQYMKNGKEYYEVSNGKYLLCIDETGCLMSCILTPNASEWDGILEIPAKVGDTKVVSIASDCFSSSELNERVTSLIIPDDSIERIEDGVFKAGGGKNNKDWLKLKKVKIGNSVNYIGNDAFAGCYNLENVYFNKPSAGYTSFIMEDSAFATTGSRLTFHGDIVAGYKPFDWATNSNNILKDKNDANKPTVNICYQSLWNSTDGTHLTVMTDKSGNVTLLDYPRMEDLDSSSLFEDDELKDFCSDMEQYYYMQYDNDSVIVNGKTVGELRKNYVIAKESGADSSELEKYYGPWINPAFCSNGAWKKYLTGEESADSGAFDWLFKPLIAEAAYGDPKPYFDSNPYNFMENYDNYYDLYLHNPSEYDALPEYEKIPSIAWNYINATKEIYIPDGVTSIDVVDYKKNNPDNYNTYIGSDRMHTSTTDGAVPGLFSGYYEDYNLGDSRENDAKGNDTIESIKLTSVKELPDYAFDSCEMLDHVDLGAVEKVGALPFRDCRNLTSLTVPEDNENYVAQNGILYEKKDNGNYKIVECLLNRGKATDANSRLDSTGVAPDPDSLIPKVDEIAESAFENCEGIAVVDLTESLVKVIPENCFKNCKGLINVLLPTSVNQIEDNSFEGIATSTHPLYVTIPGREVDISDIAFNPKQNVTIYTYEDSAAYSFAKRNAIAVEKLDSYRVYFYDYNGDPIGDVQIAKKDSNGQFKVTEPEDADVLYETGHRPGYKFTGWKSTDDKTLNDPITADMTIFVAQYEPDGTLINGKCEVTFIDGIDGKTLGDTSTGATKVTLSDGSYRFVYYVEPGKSFSALKSEGVEVPVWRDHEKDGYKFVKWMADQKEWTESTVIKSSMSVVALYEQTTTSGGSTTTSGGSTTTSGGSTTTSGSTTTTSSSKNSSNTSSSTSSSSSNTSSSGNSSNTSGSNSTAGTYTVLVENGSGSGSYAAGSTVIIAANTPADGMTFSKWTTESNGVSLASVSLPATTFVMPANNVTVTANYVAGGNAATAATTGTGNDGSTTGNKGNTVVDITKPGISNRDLATANVSGSTDNFVIKISETDEATQAVAAALTNKYGSLDNILYYAMDITLWDSTGTYQLTGDQVAGLSVDITIPIPDALVAYGGNNMAGAVVNGDQLENLNESFTTINGVPCVRFTATHFSPYTIYVDTGNLTEGMLDVTPKTGDPIHPKWFLSIGLACLSIILFLKKDKRVKVKTA